jgi:methionyl-tRNA formyltransferase
VSAPPVADRPLKVVFVTPEEPLVMPIFFRRVLAEMRPQIAAVAVVSPIYKKSSWLKQAKRFIDAFGVREFVIEAAQFAGFKAADLVRRVVPFGSYRSVKRLAAAHGVPVLTPADVNAPEFLAQLRQIGPDVVISVSCPQIFKRPLLELPPLGCINVHSALLPEYRGMLPTFWALAQGEAQTGITVHYMSPGIDGGDIIAQRLIPIGPDETLHSLMAKCKRAAAEAILDTIPRLRDGTVSVTPNPAEEGSYYSFPSREDVRRFKAIGRRLR